MLMALLLSHLHRLIVERKEACRQFPLAAGFFAFNNRLVIDGNLRNS